MRPYSARLRSATLKSRLSVTLMVALDWGVRSRAADGQRAGPRRGPTRRARSPSWRDCSVVRARRGRQGALSEPGRVASGASGSRGDSDVDVGLEVDHPGDRLGGPHAAPRRRRWLRATSAARVASAARRSWPPPAAPPGRGAWSSCGSPARRRRVGDQRRLDPRRPPRGSRASPSSRLLVSIASTTATRDQQQRRSRACRAPSQYAVAGEQGQPDAEQGEAPGRSARRSPRAARPAARAPWPGG